MAEHTPQDMNSSTMANDPSAFNNDEKNVLPSAMCPVTDDSVEPFTTSLVTETSHDDPQKTIDAFRRNYAKLLQNFNQKVGEITDLVKDFDDNMNADMKNAFDANKEANQNDNVEAILEKQNAILAVQLNKQKEMFEAKNIEMEKSFKDTLMRTVSETKKKTWCHHCWNEVTFKCTVNPPACSISCLKELMKFEPFASLPSNDSVYSLSSDTTEDELIEDKTLKNGNHQNGQDINKDAVNKSSGTDGEFFATALTYVNLSESSDASQMTQGMIED
ncbi:uncharacterized protein LOC116348275 [Contarinia nasturtii]|uniref:uncharacterized protein LOC116348275 n=1 Tax=Contarinia nasturtii TaxID=265458 RepID=UPI0012D477E5|nr:uncharacterized protein LOC116348275 [Contarinia nasturtii]XP_031635060.1 uncharacterized protein LOC116348275 [Contarinia nasturtii]XP_031635061.1 uncharacterized protein LOC116348275 [Contarinia nasturtii]XP_031635062.1 uncharacterized protein LOC116348275 [Contarinia nasturtii]XP_031635063.1 uncharacterized protein LOC116348275 [Contarinia nasturtii]XP_031635064.1 uncharacterized protein LOC116348275 [Contarinia nasturtii]